MKELELQALQYDKELAEYDKESQNRMNKLMKRQKRKRVEETVDTKSYMSQHNFFSYYGNLFCLCFLFLFGFCTMRVFHSSVSFFFFFPLSREQEVSS